MTHVLQPLDVGPFGPIKKEMQKLVHHWHGNPDNVAKKLDQYGLMRHVAYAAFEKVFSNKKTVQNAFKRTGLFPWNKIQPDVRKLKAGSIYKNSFVHEEVFPFPPGSSGPAPASPATASAAPATATSVTAATAADTSLATAPTPASDSVTVEPEVPPSSVSSPDSAPSSSTSSLFVEPLSREASRSSTVTLPTDSSSTEEYLLAEQSTLTLAQKEKKLHKFEVLMDLEEKKDMFEELFQRRKFDFPHAEFQSWLPLKLQAVGTEQEALDRVLSSRIPQNVPKKKTTRTRDMPKGDARYAPQHNEFYDWFARCKERAEKGKRKVSSTTTSGSADTDTGSPPTLVSKPPAAKRARKTGPRT